jgi:hypothetical protein
MIGMVTVAAATLGLAFSAVPMMCNPPPPKADLAEDSAGRCSTDDGHVTATVNVTGSRVALQTSTGSSWTAVASVNSSQAGGVFQIDADTIPGYGGSGMSTLRVVVDGRSADSCTVHWGG